MDSSDFKIKKKKNHLCFCHQVLCCGERQTAVLHLGKEDGSQAGEGAGEAVFSAAQGGERQAEGGELALRDVSALLT